ncbi:type I-F CRISPR-associated endoribonuclease Cas6/Csy4 [Spongorhabdus nitratireducens]
MRHAFVVQFSDSSSDFFLLAARCHQALHSFLCRHNLRNIGVAYPHWSESTVGDQIAFVCRNKPVLQKLSKHPLFSSMKQVKKFDWSDVITIQEGGSEVQYCRTQKPDKYNQAGLVRDARRREKRGIQPRKYNPEALVFEHYHSIKKREGCLHIQRKLVQRVSHGAFSSYGLSGETNPGTVPM